MTHSVGEPPASSTPSLSRSSSISGADNAGLHTSILSQVHTGGKLRNLEVKISFYMLGVVLLDCSCPLFYSSTGWLFRPLTEYHDHVCVDERDQPVRGCQAVWRFQHHGEPAVSAQTQRRRDSTAAGRNYINQHKANLSKFISLMVLLHVSTTCLQTEGQLNLQYFLII